MICNTFYNELFRSSPQMEILLSKFREISINLNCVALLRDRSMRAASMFLSSLVANYRNRVLDRFSQKKLTLFTRDSETTSLLQISRPKGQKFTSNVPIHSGGCDKMINILIEVELVML